MPSARSSRFSRAERSACPQCGRDTATSTDGVCVECWGRKRHGPRLFASSRPRRRRGGTFWEDVDDFVFGVLLPDGGGWLLALAFGLVLAAAALLLR